MSSTAVVPPASSPMDAVERLKADARAALAVNAKAEQVLLDRKRQARLVHWQRVLDAVYRAVPELTPFVLGEMPERLWDDFDTDPSDISRLTASVPVEVPGHAPLRVEMARSYDGVWAFGSISSVSWWSFDDEGAAVPARWESYRTAGEAVLAAEEALRVKPQPRPVMDATNTPPAPLSRSEKLIQALEEYLVELIVNLDDE